MRQPQVERIKVGERPKLGGGDVYGADRPNALDQHSLSGTWQFFRPLKNGMNTDLVER
jgi:hypothetical protein